MTTSDHVLGWMDDGNCQEIDGELFFEMGTGDKASVAMAKRACATCPVKDQCLEWVLGQPDTEGVFAGTTEKERVDVLEHRADGLFLTATEYFDGGGVKPLPKKLAA